MCGPHHCVHGAAIGQLITDLGYARGELPGTGSVDTLHHGNGQFSPIAEADLVPSELKVSPSSLSFLTAQDEEEPPPPQWLTIRVECGSPG